MTGRTPHRTPGERAPGRNPFEPRFEQLPETLPIFPLSGVLLLPGGKLPLNVFEPRYLAMIFDALAGHRMIGMVQPQQPGGFAGDGLPTDDGRPKVHKVGCAGRIVSFNETEDGRLLLALSGVCRFDIVRELDILALSRRPRPRRRADRARPRAPDGGAGRLLPRPQSLDRLGCGEAGGRRQSRDLPVDGPALRSGREAGASGSSRQHGARQAPDRVPRNERLRPIVANPAEPSQLILGMTTCLQSGEML
jgi:ATP-dependent protease La (LON) substrate-binding domain